MSSAFRPLLATTAAILGWASGSSATTISHAPSDGVPPVVITVALQPLAVGGEVGTAFLTYGADYSWGGVEGIFLDTDGVAAFAGIDQLNVLDLHHPVDARIVLLGTTDQGFTDYIEVEAGFAAANELLLQAFDIDGNVVGSATNGPPLGPHGRQTLIIDLAGSFEIAHWRTSCSGQAAFGVNQVTIGTPIPEPSTGALVCLGLSALCSFRRRTSMVSSP